MVGTSETPEGGQDPETVDARVLIRRGVTPALLALLVALMGIYWGQSRPPTVDQGVATAAASSTH